MIAQSSRPSPGRETQNLLGHLHASLGVDVAGAFLGVGRARQDNIGIARAPVAVAALVHDEELSIWLRSISSAPSR